VAHSTVAFVAYPVTDMARAVTFYTEVLGLTTSGLATEHWVEFDVAGVTFGVGDFPQLGKPGQAQSLALEIADLTAFRKSLSERGVASSEPFETPVCFIAGARDPDGNSIILHQAKAANEAAVPPSGTR
jgi:predicted enzyme related to lactoylglutathione lyase